MIQTSNNSTFDTPTADLRHLSVQHNIADEDAAAEARRADVLAEHLAQSLQHDADAVPMHRTDRLETKNK